MTKKIVETKNELDIRFKLSERIFKLRQNMGWSTYQLGDKINITSQAINQIENNRHYPSLRVLIRLADIFEISMKELFDFNERIQE